MKKIEPWNEKKAKQELSKRLREATEYRQNFEYHWEKNEQLMFDAEGGIQNSQGSGVYLSYLKNKGLDSANVNQNTAYAFKNIRYIHSQMSANPPAVIAQATTSDPDDRLAASAADRLVDHGRQTYDLANTIDVLSLHTLIYGTGILKMVWDSGLGEIIDIDESGNLVQEGDIHTNVLSPWDIYIDPLAENESEVRFIFQKMHIPYETALAKWPEHEELLKKASNGEHTDERPDGPIYDHEPGDEVIIFEYWEKGLAENGFDGRYALHLKDGTILGEMQPNPHRFLAAETVRKIKKKYGDLGDDVVEAKLEKIPQRAEFPFHILTDIDVPQTVYGKSALDYVGPIQDNLNRLMMTALDNAAAHGAVNVILPAGSEIADDSLVNTPFSILKIAGAQGPFTMNIPSLLGDLGPLMDREKQQIDDIMGVNESMFGQMNRETANATLQSAAAQGSMIRRRLFNKYTKTVEGVYKSFLKLVRKHIDVERLYHLIGREHPLEALEVKTMDLDGGYDLKVNFGTSFSLDPMTRQGQIQQLIPMYEKAGIPISSLVDHMQMAEMRGIHDINKRPKERMQEVFDEMIETGLYIPPEENQNHAAILAAALDYVMTREYMDLDDDKKFLVNQHIRDLKQLGANVAQTGQANPAAPIPGLV